MRSPVSSVSFQSVSLGAFWLNVCCRAAIEVQSRHCHCCHRLYLSACACVSLTGLLHKAAKVDSIGLPKLWQSLRLFFKMRVHGLSLFLCKCNGMQLAWVTCAMYMLYFDNSQTEQSKKNWVFSSFGMPFNSLVCQASSTFRKHIKIQRGKKTVILLKWFLTVIFRSVVDKNIREFQHLPTTDSKTLTEMTDYIRQIAF